MGAFLDERLPVGVRLGAKYSHEFTVDVVETAGGKEYRRLVHPYVRARFTLSYSAAKESLWAGVIGLYHRAYGTYAGFRVRAIDDYSTNGTTGAPTISDQPLSLVSSGVYQLRKEYGTGGTPLSIGLPARTIFKPVTGSVLLSVRNTLTGDHAVTGFSVDYATGQVTYPANKTKPITAITQAASAVLTVGSAHGFNVGESVYISGVNGMTQINGRRGTITAVGATTITVGINSTGFSAYSSGGTTNTRPQTGEEARGGCEFDIPCRFNTALDVSTLSSDWREAPQIEIIELISP